MTLASSGSINLAGASSSPQRSILAEIGGSVPISLISTSTRTLSGVSSGPITMPTDFYGKSWTTPTYSIYTPYGNSAAEGTTMVVVVFTGNVTTGTSALYWTISNGSTANNDFTGPMFGSINLGGTFASGNGQVNINHATDATTESTESYTFQVRTASTSGAIVASSTLYITQPSPTSYLYYFGNTGYSSFGGAYYFTVPAGMTSVELLLVGGGGGGGTSIYTGSGSSVAGAGGGGGGQVKAMAGMSPYTVTPGELLTVFVGAGGGSGSAGGITSIQGNIGATYVEAEGGGAGGNPVSSGSSGGTGGNSKNFSGSVIYGGLALGGYASGYGAGGAGTTYGGSNGGSGSGPGGNGGSGSSFSIGGFIWELGGGGGGGGYGSTPPASASSGGLGSGGAGSQGSTNNPQAGGAYTGGGGGGARGMSSSPTNQGGAMGGSGVVYFTSSVQPTPKLPSAGVSLTVDYGDATGGYAQGWNELLFLTDGRMTVEEGNNSAYAIAYNVSQSWLNSSPAGTSTSTAGLYDIELTPSASTLSKDGVYVTNEFSGATRSTNSTGTAWNTRLQLGLYEIGRFLICDADNSGAGGTTIENETLDFTATIYLHATNTVVTSTQVQFYVQVYSGTPV